MKRERTKAIGRRQVLGIAARFSALCGVPTGLFAASNVSNEDSAWELQFPAMGSLINIRWIDLEPTKRDSQSIEQFRRDAKQLVERWNRIMSDYDDESEISQKASQADQGDWQTVSPELAEVLQTCHEWNLKSEGAFDAALGAITSLRRRRKLPPSEAWEHAKSRSGWGFVEWDKPQNRFRTLKPGVRFDFGAIGKGFVADKLADWLRKQGIDSFAVNFDGNMAFGSAPPNRIGWPVVIESIDEMPTVSGNSTPKTLYEFRLANCAIATSGDRWQKFPDAKSQSAMDRSSHILDPATGYGLVKPQSVSVITSRASDADAAATAGCVMIHRNRGDWLASLGRNRLQRGQPEFSGVIQFQRENEVEVSTFGDFREKYLRND